MTNLSTGAPVGGCTRCGKPCLDGDAPDGFCAKRCARLAAEKARGQARAQGLAERTAAPLTAAEVCGRKRRFPDEASADAMAAILGARKGRSLEAYACGSHWHHRSGRN